jgi:SpoVK/Ycf46/Vps4 family AAA+-type ATPase
MKIKLFNPVKDSSFPNHNLDAWVCADLYNTLCKQAGNPQELFVEVRSKDPLNSFCFFLKLQQLNDKTPSLQESIFVSDDLKSSQWTLENDTEVTVNPLTLNELPLAEVLTIKLKEEEVIAWSNEEETFAINVYLTQNTIAYVQQKAWIKPATKKTTLGIITDVKTSNKGKGKNTQICYQVNSSTKVVFLGLPEERQKVIDFSKIGGLENIVIKLREIIQIPLQYPELLGKFDIKPPKGLILHGPPGNGKTMIARAVSHSLGAKFIYIEGPELLSRYVGVAEQQLRAKFEEAESHGNCVLFIDEIDAIAASRDSTNAEHQISIVATLLTLMDGIKTNQKVFVLAATNRIHAIDPALRRPGRFDLEFEIPLPDKNARFDILTKYINTENKSILNQEIDKNYLSQLSEITNGYSGADLYSLYREASMNSIRSKMKFDETTGKISLKVEPTDIRLSKSDFEQSVRTIVPTAMRGIDNKSRVTTWDDIIGLDAIKLELEKVINLRSLDQVNSSHKYSFYNILLEGIVGSGKSTVVSALGQKFNYEVLNLDFLNLTSLSLFDAFKEIELLFTKGKQIAPSIIHLTNLINIDSNQTIAIKILNEANQLNAHHKILFIAESDLKSVPDFFMASGKFGKTWNFTDQMTEESLKLIYDKKISSSKISFDEFAKSNRGKGVGRILSDIYELKILSQI